MGPPLLEREQPLAALGHALDQVRSGRGEMILVSGEAGVGKTTLVRHFVTSLERVTVATGVCDPTPTALGPLLDIAPGLGATGDQLLNGPAAVLSCLTALTEPAVLVFEDLHWADQASLDLIGHLGRRIERLRTLLIATFREEEAPEPLQVALGDLATAPGVRRLTLAPLTLEATAQLAHDSSADAHELHRRTGGNPFYITEVLGAGGEEVPATVRDAVLARLARRTPEARQALQVAAAIGARIDPGLLARVLGALDVPRWGVDEAVGAGLLERHGAALAFRHELARTAIASVTPPPLRQRLHATILGELRRSGAGPDDGASLVAHAEAAGDDAAVLELAPLAGDRAAALGAHREAAQLYSAALERAQAQPQLTASLLERRGQQRYVSRRFESALEDHRLAARLCADLGDRLGEARNLVRIAHLNLAGGDDAECAEALGRATALLEALPPTRELAFAYETRARRHFLSNEGRPAAEWADRAAVMAAQTGDEPLALEARATAGVVRLREEDEAAPEELREARDRALELGLRDLGARITYYLAFMPMTQRRYDGVDRFIEEGTRYALENDLEYWQSMMAAARALRALDAGRWDDAMRVSNDILAMRDPAFRDRLTALVAIARIAARRGSPDAQGHLDQAIEHARHDRTMRIYFLWPARVEAAWLAGDSALALLLTAEALADGPPDPWAAGEVALWARLAGGTVRAEVAGPHQFAVAGDWAGAARCWEERGCPYEMAVSLAMAGDDGAVRRAIAMLDQLSARPAADFARRRLRELGAASVPRGPRPSTTADPAGLTRREREVLSLVAEGLGNAQVASRLFLSEKTVERHLAGIFAKLSVSSRADAVRAYRQIEGGRAPI